VSPLDDVLMRIARKIRDLDAIQVRHGLPALALQDPRDIAVQMSHQAQVAANFLTAGYPAVEVTEAVGAQAAALLMALARVAELDVSAGAAQETG
jgi:hypothetical protein